MGPRSVVHAGGPREHRYTCTWSWAGLLEVFCEPRGPTLFRSRVGSNTPLSRAACNTREGSVATVVAVHAHVLHSRRAVKLCNRTRCVSHASATRGCCTRALAARCTAIRVPTAGLYSNMLVCCELTCVCTHDDGRYGHIEQVRSHAASRISRSHECTRCTASDDARYDRSKLACRSQ